MAAASLYSTILIAFVVAVALVPQIATAAAENTKPCTCYRTSSDDYYSNYKFHDFRNVAYGSIPTLQSTLPGSANDSTGQSSEPVGMFQDGFISSKEWTSSWSILDWGKRKSNITKYRMWNSFSNVFIDKNTDGSNGATTKLVLRTKRFSEFQSSAEIENAQKNMLYASTRIRLRVTGDSGAVAGMFYYRDDTNESDIEILTRDKHSVIHYTNQPGLDKDGNEIKDASTVIDHAGIKWTDWHTHRIDWVEGKSSWYIDGKHIVDKTYGVPTMPAVFILNFWSDGGIWSGEMAENREARMEIEWVEIVFNTSDSGLPSRSTAKFRRSTSRLDCKVECTVDVSGEGTLYPRDHKPMDTPSSARRNSTLWSGTDDRDFMIATAIGATVAVVLYIVDTAL
ncbi:concanavalin A-like lectin/glucanase domain-containing protein [Trichophaea hybrida]|nr:concanavalin A-like lectin/glucanase domain-containing protein [Trichophaea hybrida]